MTIKRSFSISALVAAMLAISPTVNAQEGYVPTEENLRSRQEFSDARFGIFLHWGIYSMYAQGEWYLSRPGLSRDEYAKAAGGFYPAGFDAEQWVTAFKEAGAKYICFTTRHHDGFSMFDTQYSDYDIIDATPWKRDIVKELADECHRQDLRIHLYYSLIDWTRDDYPAGRSAPGTGKVKANEDWRSYYNFMNAQLTELLTRYGKIGAIWFDGVWDHDQDKTPFDWEFGPMYENIHTLQPGCLIANNHHEALNPGEDIQVFERDLPGENKAGYATNQVIGNLPLETCQTMNGMWGYKLADQDYKSVDELVRLLVGAAGKGGNLLLNVGPQPDGRLPEVALERLAGMGKWLGKYGDSIYGTVAGDIPVQDWGATTRKGDRLFVHVWDASQTVLFLPLDVKVKSARDMTDGAAVKFDTCRHGVHLILPQPRSGEPERVIELFCK